MVDSRELFLRKQILANGRFVHQYQQKTFHDDHTHTVSSADIEVVLGGTHSERSRACLVNMTTGTIMFTGGWHYRRMEALEALLTVLERQAEVILRAMAPYDE